MKERLLLGVIITGILTACESIPMISDIDVLRHKNRGDLPLFYDQLKADLKVFEPQTDESENRKIYIEKVGKKIAEEKEQSVLESLDREYEKHSISRLNEALTKAKEIEPLSKVVYSGLKSDIEQAIVQKKNVIEGKEAEFHELSDKDAPQKVVILEEIAAIYGGLEAEQTKNRRKTYIASLFTSAQEALKVKRHEEVLMHLDSIAKIDPNYPKLEDMRNALVASEYEGQFWDAVENGNADKVYESFHRLTQIPNYVANHPDVVESADVIAQYFVEEGDKLIKIKDINSSYQFYSRARYMNNVMGKGSIYTPSENIFVEAIDKRIKEYSAKSLTVPIYGLVSILEELTPNHPSVAQYKQSTTETMLKDATIKIVPAGFSGTEAQSTIGIGVVSKINQKLLNLLDKKVQVIESSAVATEYRSSQIVTKTNPTAYIFLSGEILDAKVTDVQNTTSITKRVVTHYSKVPNPEYAAWKEEDDDDIPAPPTLIDKPVEEDVTINKTIAEKQGVFSITYRLADAVSASVLFSDSLTKTEVATGENIQGVELGLFIQAPKVTELPSNESILEKLTTQISDEVSAKIAENVKLIETSYSKKADQAVILEDFNTAAANYGYRNVLLESQGKTDEETSAKMRLYALRWQ